MARSIDDRIKAAEEAIEDREWAARLHLFDGAALRIQLAALAHDEAWLDAEKRRTREYQEARRAYDPSGRRDNRWARPFLAWRVVFDPIEETIRRARALVLLHIEKRGES